MIIWTLREYFCLTFTVFKWLAVIGRSSLRWDPRNEGLLGKPVNMSVSQTFLFFPQISCLLTAEPPPTYQSPGAMLAETKYQSGLGRSNFMSIDLRFSNWTPWLRPSSFHMDCLTIWIECRTYNWLQDMSHRRVEGGWYQHSILKASVEPLVGTDCTGALA